MFIVNSCVWYTTNSYWFLQHFCKRRFRIVITIFLILQFEQTSVCDFIKQLSKIIPSIYRFYAKCSRRPNTMQHLQNTGRYFSGRLEKNQPVFCRPTISAVWHRKSADKNRSCKPGFTVPMTNKLMTAWRDSAPVPATTTVNHSNHSSVFRVLDWNTGSSQGNESRV